MNDNRENVNQRVLEYTEIAIIFATRKEKYEHCSASVLLSKIKNNL